MVIDTIEVILVEDPKCWLKIERASNGSSIRNHKYCAPIS